MGNLEIETQPDGLTQTKRYVGNNVIDTHRSNGTRTTHYLGHDHIGSIDIITDEAGTLLENLSFDLWGNRRDATGWSVVQQPFTQLSLDTVLNITRRGFTGHEHVDHADVIHMNGRIYDPTLGRLMQADPIVQQPENLQNLNRYTYVFNNPLSYTDPTGYCAASSFSTKQPGCDVQQQAEVAAVTNDKETKEAKENEGAAASESNESGGWLMRST